MKFDIERNKLEQSFFDSCQQNRLEKRKFIKAVRRVFKAEPRELRNNFTVLTAENCLYAYSVSSDTFYPLTNPDCYCGVLKEPDQCSLH